MLCAMAAVVGSCTKKAAEDGRPILAVSLEPQRYMLEQIVGDNFRIVALMPNGDNPETFDPSPASRISQLDIFPLRTTCASQPRIPLFL